MHVTLVHVQVKANHVEDFVTVTKLNHQESVKESGNFRFDVLQSLENPNHFVLYEAYFSVEDAVAHKQTAHYLRWRDTVSDWMAEPRQGILFEGLFPEG